MINSLKLFHLKLNRITFADCIHIPIRGVVQAKKKKVLTNRRSSNNSEADIPAHLRFFRPHLPLNLVTETINFLQNQTKLRALLELIYPRKPAKAETEDERCRFQRNLEIFDTQRQHHEQAFASREVAAYQAMWRAIEALPAELQEEAQSSSTSNEFGKAVQYPESLLFNKMYRDQIMKSLSDYELRQLQAYQNLMYVRYPHAETKKSQPHLFWISEKQALNRQKEQAMKSKTKK